MNERAERITNDFSGTRLTFYSDTQVSHSLQEFIRPQSTINPWSMFDFLLFGSILPPHSPLEGVRQLFPGETRTAIDGSISYLDMAYTEQEMSVSEFADSFDRILTGYFSEHPETATVLLSGGIDSAILLSYLPKGATAITWGGRGEDTPDVLYSRMTARAFDIGDHHMVFADYDRDFALYKRAVQELKIPILFNSAVPFLRMTEKGSEIGVTDWLVGQNADTLFMSYPAPVLTNRLSKLNTILPWNPLGYLPSRKAYGFKTSSKVRLLAYFKSLGIYPGSWIDIPDAYFDEKESILTRIPAHNEQQRMIILEELLTESRRNQICQNEIPALAGITSLCPYYDERIVRLALSVPPRVRRSRGYSKQVLKELAKKRGVPEEVIYKQKSGLSYGLNEFMLQKRHLPVWDEMEKDVELNRLIDVRSVRAREEGNYLTFIMLSSLHYWFEWVARPEGLTLPK